MCQHRYKYRSNTPISKLKRDVRNCYCLRSVRPENYPGCICVKGSSWKCELCGDEKHAMLMKSCCVCGYGICGPVSYSQHYHDECVPSSSIV